MGSVQVTVNRAWAGARKVRRATLSVGKAHRRHTIKNHQNFGGSVGGYYMSEGALLLLGRRQAGSVGLAGVCDVGCWR